VVDADDPLLGLLLLDGPWANVVVGGVWTVLILCDDLEW